MGSIANRPEDIARQIYTSQTFIVFVGLFISCLLISNIAAGRLVQVWSMILPGGFIIFPIVYILGDIITEIYGYRIARTVILTGFAANVFMIIVFCVLLALPRPFQWDGHEAYIFVFSYTPRIVIASLAAYLLGGLSNAIILSKMKVIFQGEYLWVRTIGSSLVGQATDSIIFVVIGFYSVVSSPLLWPMIISQYLFKISVEVLLTPITCFIIAYFKERQKIDIYDTGVSCRKFEIKDHIHYD